MTEPGTPESRPAVPEPIQAPPVAAVSSAVPGPPPGSPPWGAPAAGSPPYPGTWPAARGERAGAAALVVFWVGLLAVGVINAVPDPTSWPVSHMRTVWYVADALYVLFLGLTGLLARRGALSPVALLLWVAGALLLAADVVFVQDLARSWHWGVEEMSTVARVATSVATACFAAAYLAVRRSPGVRHAFVPVALVVALLWFLLGGQAFAPARFDPTLFRLENGVLLSGGTAVVALVVFLAGKVGTTPPLRPWPVTAGPAWPQAGGPAQPYQQWAAQPPGWGQPGWGPAQPGWGPPPQQGGWSPGG